MNTEDRMTRLSRIVDRDESPEDWSALENAAREDPSIWAELRALLRDDCHVRHALAPQIARSSLIEATASTESRGFAIEPSPPERRGGSRWFSLGFAAMLPFVLGLVVGYGGSHRESADATAGSAAVPDTLLARYIEVGRESGRVVEELPSLTLDVESLGDEGLRVFFVRRIVEQKRVSGAWTLAIDEHGTAVPVRADPRELEASRGF